MQIVEGVIPGVITIARLWLSTLLLCTPFLWETRGKWGQRQEN